MNVRHWWRQPSAWLRIVIVTGYAVMILFPLAFIADTSFMSDAQAGSSPAQFVPNPFRLSSYSNIFSQFQAGSYLLHSIEAVLGSTICVLLVGVPAAYAIARHRFVFNLGMVFVGLLLAARFFPGFGLLIPIFRLYRELGLYDTVTGLIILYTAINVPIVIFVVMPAARQLPQEVLEAALIDGASLFRCMVRVAVPMLRPAIATAATLAIIFTWNDFGTALVFTNENAQTAQVLLSKFITQGSTQYGSLSAVSMFVALPVVAFGILAQRHLVRGVSVGAVK